MLLKELKCPGCGAPLKSKERDIMLKCDHCGRISLFADGKINDVGYSIASPAKEHSGELIYVPFWIVNADLNVHKESISGGKISRFITDQRQMRGTRDFYVCASAIPEEFARKWNMDLTLDQPKLNLISDFKGGKRAVMTMRKEIAGENAEFLFLRYEAEIPGTLQKLDYDFRINSTKVLYLPAYKISDKYVLGVSNE
ncbi:MAG: hypothetical protein M0P20_05560 [Methanocorpusculum sp.]|jgi:hypothetical protein|nr:hypothetical protein [Methanocorpusculum sp.]MDD3257237.1 zinc ribbon domain-containing protein [Methanocorpusculum sp.]MDD4132337.1 zinc ribbon domain-containing protein [Methanocorpusculum sp.]